MHSSVSNYPKNPKAQQTFHVGVVGGGAFGQALAHAIARNGHKVSLQTRQTTMPNLPESIHLVSDLKKMAETELVFLAVPSVHIVDHAKELGSILDGRHMIVHVSRGLVGSELETVSRTLRRLTPCRRLGCLAGPINARVLMDAAPGGGIVGSEHQQVVDAVREVLGGDSLRLYHTDDILGVELSSALVGLLALALGYALEHRFEPGTLSVFLNRGMSEVARIGTSLGGHERTFVGMAGYGDLIAAVAGDERPEVKLGRALGQGLTGEEAAKQAGAYIEGIRIAKQVAVHGERMGIETPICSMLAHLLEGKVETREAVFQLMTRRWRSE